MIEDKLNNKKHTNEEESFDFLSEFFKYFFHWRYFLFSLIFFVVVAYFFNRYNSKLFETKAKIQILDKKENNLIMPSAENLFSKSSINVENELEVIKSSAIFEQVIKNLNLNLSVEGLGDITSSQVLDYPFSLELKIHSDSILKSSSYNLRYDEKILIVTDILNEKEYLFDKLSTVGVRHQLPFEVLNINEKKWLQNIKNFGTFNITLVPNSILVTKFKKDIIVSKLGRDSDIIELKHRHPNRLYSQNLLNEIIDVFNNDGIRDRQLIHKRTIDFVNDRYSYLAAELESIETNKKIYKVKNNLVDFQVNSNISLRENSIFEENIFSNENQIFLVSNLLDEISKLDFQLLPSNVGLENIEVNTLIQSYNQLILDQKKLITSAGSNNPFVQQLNNSIIDTRKNIISSLKNYLFQLNILKEKLIDKSKSIQSNVANFPGQEKNLRSIERNQQIKESLYLFLLQKGEEAQISFVVTEPSIKVVEYAISTQEPIFPQKSVIYLIAVFIGFFIPFLVLYFIFLLDNKVHIREDLEKFSLNILGEIPFFDLPESEKVFLNPDDRSIISESFRMLMSNVRYLQNNDSESNVILVTSSIKGEGKTLNALNLALSFSSVGKKVLLIGCDLRNPQLHKYIGFDKNISGLVDSLVDNKTEWKKNIINPFESQPLDILLSGPLPPNPLNLINNGNIDILLKDLRKSYDHIIIDSAPTLLVADTQSLINKSDILIFVTRCNVTDKDVLSHISKVSDESHSNVGVILNGVGEKNSYGYSYGYRYGYGYNYKYSYNYGYGYGYNEESS